MAFLSGPDVLLQPAHERQIVRQPAHQCHRGMRVRIDQSRDEHMLVERDALVARKARTRLRHGQHRFDVAVAHGDGVLGENAACRLDRNEPARLEEKRARYFGVPWISTSTRRFGARHSMSALRSFWSGQDFTGVVLPKPKVSTLDASTPFDTR